MLCRDQRFLCSTVPQPTSVEVYPSQNNDIFTRVTFTLTCAVYLPLSVDIPVIVDTVWTRPNGSMLVSNGSITNERILQYLSNASFSSNTPNDNAEYHCSATVRSNHAFLTTSKSRTGSNQFTISKKL